MEQVTATQSSPARSSHTLLRSVLTLMALLLLLICIVMWWWVTGSDAFDSLTDIAALPISPGDLLRSLA
ncbi:hypothetical protein [Dyella silvatica]|uniref:hypothetical protein n=1 Tax=Dyella silvatica TaxID=2992128 RepID=UPI002259E968|nr:hypothetical protein [Dyella silvatica]